MDTTSNSTGGNVDPYYKYDTKEKERVKEIVNEYPCFKIERFTDRYEPYDADLSIDGKEVMLKVEVKVRNFEHQRYPTAIIEKRKVDGMNNTCEEGVSVPVIFSFYEDGVCLVFYVNNENKYWGKLKCPKETKEDKGTRFKDVFHYPIDKYDMKLNIA